MTKRPKLRTPENAEHICRLLAEGFSLRQVARELQIESAGSITDWVRDDAEFAVRYTRGMELRCNKLADELLELADTPCLFDGRPDNALVQQLRVRIDARKWLLSKLLPKKFGDRVVQELVGDPNQPIVTRIELVPVAPLTRQEEDPPVLDAGGEAALLPLRALSR